MRTSICVVLSSINGQESNASDRERQVQRGGIALYLCELNAGHECIWIHMLEDTVKRHRSSIPRVWDWIMSSVWRFSLCIFVIAQLSEKAVVPEICQAAEKCVLHPRQHNLFLLKSEILREVPRVPLKFRIWRGVKGNHIHSLDVFAPTAPLPGNAQYFHLEYQWIKGSSPPAGERRRSMNAAPRGGGWRTERGSELNTEGRETDNVR